MFPHINLKFMPDILSKGVCWLVFDFSNRRIGIKLHKHFNLTSVNDNMEPKHAA